MNWLRKMMFNNDSTFGRNMIYLGQLFFSFLKMTPATFGGGYAMIPLLYREVVNKRRWILSSDFHNVVTIAGSTPGAIAINCASLIGYRIAGIAGAIAAVLGVLLPTFIIVVVLGILFILFNDNLMLMAAFQAIRMTIIAMVVYAAIKMMKPSIYDKFTVAIFILSVLLLIFTPIHPVWIITISGLVGIIVVQMKAMLGLHTRLIEREKEDEDEQQNTFIGEGI